jgi:hypothetical protein
MKAMKKIIPILIAVWLLPALAAAASKDDNRMKAAEKAMSEKRYADAKATFMSLKDSPKYREKCHLYLSLIFYENGQIDNALTALDDFKRYVTDKTDVSLIKTSENLENELDNSYSSLEIAIFDKAEGGGVDPGFYNLSFSSEGGLSPAQEARLRIINKTLSDAQNLFAWKSDGTFLKGKIRNFPIRMYDTSPMTADVNGVPIYFRFDFQTRQGLWIPSSVTGGATASAVGSSYREGSADLFEQPAPKKKNDLKYLLIGAAGVVAGALVGVAASQ